MTSPSRLRASRVSKARGPAALSVPVWLIVAPCSVLPLLWLAWQIVTAPDALSELRIDAFRAGLLARTAGYSLAAGLLATALALPAAQVIGRGRGRGLVVLAFVLPLTLLLPSITYAYGWSQLVRLTDSWWRAIGLDFAPASAEDVVRCIWSLGCWLWPLPAAAIGLSLRRLDDSIQQQALLDGAVWRVTARSLLPAAAASAAIVSALAMQEFAVFEPTGISVLATETRMVFDTGALSAADNPITAPMGPAAAGAGAALPDQARRAAAAVVTAVPLVAMIGLLAAPALWWLRKSAVTEAIEGPASWPRALNAGGVAWATTAILAMVSTLVPLVALWLSLRTAADPLRLWRTFQPAMTGSLMIALLTGLVAAALGLGVLAARASGAFLVSIVSFLVGGQLLAIALIRIYNRPWLDLVYNQPPIIVMAYLARFGWLAVLAGRASWQGPWRDLREQASVDGAGPIATALQVVAPLAWPIVGAAAVLVAVLSLSEVPATVLITPMRPQLLTPLLMGWVHMLRYDPMIEGSLLLAATVSALTLIAVTLAWLGRRAIGSGAPIRRGLIVLSAMPLIGLAGCGDGSSPQAIWCRPGSPDPQVIYPRAVAYSSGDDTFVIIDRMARVQRIDHDGRALAEWRMPAKERGKPVGVSVGPDGNIYVPDTHYHRVIVYSPTGQIVRQWGAFGRGPGEFIYPTDIAFDSKGQVFVAEYGDNDRIQVFSPTGEFRYAFGRFGQGTGEFVRPQSIVIDNDIVYVADSCNHRICVFRADGTFVRSFGSIGSGLGEFRYPYGLDMDGEGRLVVCEFGNNRVQLIDPQTGQGLATWGAAGHDPGQLAYPWASAVDSRRGRVVAVDSGNNRLQVFSF